MCVLCSPGPPLPPQEVQVQCGQTPGLLQVRWKPPPLTSSGTSNGASVIGYAVCTKGQKVLHVRQVIFVCATVLKITFACLCDEFCEQCYIATSWGNYIVLIFSPQGQTW